MDYISTRGKAKQLDFCEVLLEGLATDGGLYMPVNWPDFSFDKIKNLQGLSYQDLAFEIMQPFVAPALSYNKLKKAIYSAVSSFNHKAVTPLIQIGDNDWIMELYHGKTLAFKDHALQLLGQLFDIILEDKKDRVTIVGATSGDTGSAAIEACKNCKNVDIFILHPKGRVSDVQRRQMTTVDSANVFNIAIEGDFDDCQNLVKALFGDEAFRRKLKLSAINSINWARIMAQIVYYFRAGTALGAPDKKPYFVVPTGNFGNIFAGFAAHKMGLPVSQLVVASNANDILHRFFETAVMQKHQVVPSLSPSMDIQISSNFERLLFEIFNRDSSKVCSVMEKFSLSGKYEVESEVLSETKTLFASGRCSDDETKEEIKRVYQETGVLIDPHTAVGVFTAKKLKDRDFKEPLVVLSTAHPAKFPDAVKAATGKEPKLPPFLKDLFIKQEKYITLDKNIDKLKSIIISNSRVTRGE
ncbi:MAG: threonine synthase [Alphaproteobacteria bacterium]